MSFKIHIHLIKSQITLNIKLLHKIFILLEKQIIKNKLKLKLRLNYQILWSCYEYISRVFGYDLFQYFHELCL